EISEVAIKGSGQNGGCTEASDCAKTAIYRTRCANGGAVVIFGPDESVSNADNRLVHGRELLQGPEGLSAIGTQSKRGPTRIVQIHQKEISELVELYFGIATSSGQPIGSSGQRTALPSLSPIGAKGAEQRRRGLRFIVRHRK